MEIIRAQVFYPRIIIQILNPSKRIILFKIKLIKRIYSRIYYDEILKMTLKKIERYPNKEEKSFQLFLCCIITVLDYVIHV